MAFNKVEYIDQVTVITADNLNSIQDELIRVGGDLTTKVDAESVYMKEEVDARLAELDMSADLELKVDRDEFEEALAGKADARSIDASLALINEALTARALKVDVDTLLEEKVSKEELADYTTEVRVQEMIEAIEIPEIPEIPEIDLEPVYEALEGKADITHRHEMDEITGLTEALEDRYTKSDVDALFEALEIPEGVDLSPIYTALTEKAEVEHLHDITDVAHLSETLATFLTQEEVQALIDEIEIPEGVDITPLQEAIQALETTVATKADARDLEQKADHDHAHNTLDVEGLDVALADRYTKEEVDELLGSIHIPETDLSGIKAELATKADKGHKHEIADIHGLTAALETKVTQEDVEALIEAIEIPEPDFTPLEDALKLKADKEEVEELLEGKANTLHLHDISTITGLQAELANRYTKSDVDDLFELIEIPDLSPIESELALKATKSELEARLKTVTDALNARYTKEEVDRLINAIEIPEFDPSALEAELATKATKSELAAGLANKADASELDKKADADHQHTTSDIAGLADALAKLEQIDTEAPRIYYQADEPALINGTIWIVAD